MSISGAVVGSVGKLKLRSCLTYSSLYFLSKSIIAPKVHSLRLIVGIQLCPCSCRGIYPFFPLLTQLLVFHCGVGPPLLVSGSLGSVLHPNTEWSKVAAYWGSLAPLCWREMGKVHATGVCEECLP